MRYLNSFFITAIIYLVATFFLFFLFADTLIIPEKEPQKKISLTNINLKAQEEPKTQEVVKENVENKIDDTKPKVQKPKPTQIKEKKIIKEAPKEVSITTEKTNETNEVEKPTSNKEVEIKESSNTHESKNLEEEYLAKLLALIEKYKSYPSSAKRLNQSGKVYVSFTILKTGDIKNIKITSSSNYEKLDFAALNIFTQIGNIDSIPEKLNKQSWDITVPIVYQISSR